MEQGQSDLELKTNLFNLADEELNPKFTILNS